MEIEQEMPLQPKSNGENNQQSNHIMMSYPWVRFLLITATVKSILGLIILFLLLAVSTIVFIIGFHFRHSNSCPIEPKISLLLMIAGSVSAAWIILSFILSIITITQKHIRSFILVTFNILTALLIVSINIFLVIWLTIGSIWTLKALNTVQHTDPYLKTFCRQTLYQFTLGYLVVTYILSALQCWYRLCVVIFCSIQEQ